MAKRKTVDTMGAAECARRTGLTVRALRIYERHGLVKPARTASGWRCYGSQELVRLNAITALKSLGLSLSQIQRILTGPTPAIADVLRMQVGALDARRVAVENALLAARETLARLDSQQPLSLDELCNLVRRIQMTEQPNQRLRELINKQITPEEERAWVTYHAHHSREEVNRGMQFASEYRQVFLDLAALARAHADPAGPEAQGLVDRHNELLLEHRVREKAIAALEWNPQVAGKFLALGGQYYGDTGETDPASAQRVADFILSALKASPASQALNAIRDRAANLMDRGEAPSSAAAQALAADLRATAARYRFGDPLVLTKWTASRGKMRLGENWVDLGERERGAWEYLGRTLAEAAAAA
jgi:MerR family transcriptional regulator, thiopeptide resistance regulator